MTDRPAFSWREDPGVPRFPDQGPLIVFDGLCALCSANAQFVLRHDRLGAFRLTHAQSPLGLALYRHFGLTSDAQGTMIVLRDGRLLSHSDAAIAIAEGLGWPWRAAKAAGFLPRSWRDAVYRGIARNRYRWFARRETCWLPSPRYRDRML